jgi:hypothetical protein
MRVNSRLPFHTEQVCRANHTNRARPSMRVSRWPSIHALLGFLVCLSLLGLSACSLVGAAEPQGFFRVELREGRWWFIDPAGKPFISKGVCHVTFSGDTIRRTDSSPYRDAVSKKYGGAEGWRAAAARRLLDLGFNTLGAWSDEAMTALEFDGRRLACAPTVDLGAGFVDEKGGQAWLNGIFPDVFDPAFAAFARRRAAERCKPRADDRSVLGWFTDNELRWGPDWRGKEELLSLFLDMPVGSAGRAAAVRLLRERHGDVAKFNAIWKTSLDGWEALEKAVTVVPPYVRKELYAQNEGEERSANEKDPARAAFVADCEAFAGLVAEQYFSITRDAIRAADPHHLNFGCRFAYVPSAAVIEVSQRYLDAISFNCYQVDPRKVIRAYAVFKKPLIIGEFTFRGRDSGLPNTRGAGPHVDTQTERAAAFARYVELALGEPEIVGYHWFQHNDQPKEGRFDGENSNYGVVDKNDERWPELTGAMRATNAKAEALHRAPLEVPKTP